METDFVNMKDLEKLLINRIGTHEFPSYRDLLEFICKKTSKTGYLVFDAGCGKGGFLAKLPEHIIGIGLDIEKKNVIEARKNSELKNRFFIVGDLHYLPFKKDSFNIVCCRNVLEHVRNGDLVIDQLTFILKVDGVILVSTTNLLNPAMLLDTLLPNDVGAKIISKLGGPQYHERYRRFSPWKIIRKFRENKLSVKLLMLGVPPIGEPWNYYNKNVNLPKRFYPWIIFDKTTNFSLLKKFKEMIICIARN